MRRLRLLFVLGIWSFAGCASEEAKEARPAGPSLGQEIFGVLCDRVGAHALREDLTGISYQNVCHGDASTVDQSKLAPAPDAAVRARSVAKVEALARHKVDIIAALETVFPDDIVVGKNLDAADPVASCDPVSSKTRREQLRGLLSRLLPKEGDELVPESSRAAARSIEPLTTEQGASARAAMMHLSARRGYMPPELATGLLGAVLTAPRLRDMLGATMHLLGPDASPYDAPGTKGKGYGALKQVLAAVQEDMREPFEQEAPLTLSTDAAGRPILSRPRTTLELARAVLLTEHPVFTNGPPLWVVKRDYRGMAVVAKKDGALPDGFVDGDGDGLPDLDAQGRFKGNAPDPFVGSEKNPLYEYVDARSTAASALVRHIAPLADPDNGNEAVFNAAEGLAPLLKEREALLDLVHAAGQMSADPGTDDALALFGQLFEKEPELMARVTGDLLDAKAILDAHPEAKLPDGSTLFDDVLDVMLKWSAEPGLVEDVLTSMADERAVYIKQAIPAQMLYRDRITYDPNALSGLPINTTAGKGASAPETLVDRTKPNTGWNRSIFQRFLSLLADTNGVTFCNKEDAVLHGYIKSPVTGEYVSADLPLEGPAPECALIKIDNLSVFYLRAMIGKAPLQFRPAFFNPEEPKPPVLTPEVLTKSTGIGGFWDATLDGRDPRVIYPRPEFLNRQVFYQIDPNLVCTEANKHSTACVLKDLQGMHIPSSACAARPPMPDPWAGDDTVIDKPPVGATISGLRSCTEGQYMDQRNPDTLFALEYNHGYEAFAPLVEVFVKHQKEQLLIDLMIALDKHWKVQGGVASVEPALGDILKSTDIVASLGKLGRVTNGMKVDRCIASGDADCAKKESVPAVQVLAEGMRAMIDPARAAASGVTDRKGGTTTKSGKPISIMGLLRDAISAEEAVLAKDKTRENKWLTARSRIVDEFLTVDGRGDEAKFRDPGVPQIAPVIIELLRAQRLAKCKGDTACPALRKDLALDVEETLKGNLVTSGLDLLDVILRDKEMRGELGRMTSYMFRQDGPLGGDKAQGPSSTPFAGKARGPGVLDQSIAALVDALGAMGDMKDVRAMYPVLAHSLDDLDPQLSLLSRLNARAYDEYGNEICARELDPEEAIRNSLARLSLPVSPPGRPTRPALQIFLEAIADVHRVDAAEDGPLDPDDYANVFQNVHELLTDPESGLEQLYASVKNATER
ncbi:MAG: hypothetical protein KIT84_14720 [Labilithrix sp.]|nr:hypothetical protein [Labilithrix sp.]MCW5812275.1 hypothetical protein [Labilithrix sp.]